MKIDHFETALKMTLLMFMIFVEKEWYLRFPITIIAISGLLIPQLLKQPYFWLSALSFQVFANYFSWYEIDNHKYLMAYWTFAIYISSFFSDGEKQRILYFNGKNFIGICMLLAVMWKLITEDYLTTDFFVHTLATDPRFQNFAHYLTGISHADLLYNQVQLDLYDIKRALLPGAERVFELKLNPAIQFLGLFMTWWTIAIESLIGVVFILPEKVIKPVWAHCLLIAFVISTYAIATVGGFAWLLIIMAYVVASYQGLKRIPYCYLALFLLIQVYRFPFADLVNTWALEN